ncbi:AAC(3) family N-acetyltransferase [Leptospira ilyithenensis]|uniref:Uncharacterized protein n=1 Tax=Leptospira ilyithenensis TaxID=2484901 RepID=A0A4R9LSB3_9LEPT|nr:AAC(3) family N-acetyltransferase [Leptospira ilyithenensis]TGN09786.1 hypothetical protein EHS11_11935 [Leptospira ilyithenensis]
MLKEKIRRQENNVKWDWKYFQTILIFPTKRFYETTEPEPEIFHPYFDPKHSPASESDDMLTEIIRPWAGAVRSLNPGASTIAIAKMEIEYGKE